MKNKILYEDNHILVCHKPAGIATQTAKIGQKDMVSELKNYLGKDAYVGLIHRLDQPVEGVLVFAKTTFAAKELSKQLTSSMFHKQYYAVVSGKGFLEETTLTDYLIKESKGNVSRIASPTEKGAKKAQLIAKTIAYREAEDIALVNVTLLTGRHHQIRIQLAAAGAPLLGDTKYGVAGSQKNIALCAYKLAFVHPKTKKEMEFCIEPEGAIFGTFSEIHQS